MGKVSNVLGFMIPCIGLVVGVYGLVCIVNSNKSSQIEQKADEYIVQEYPVDQSSEIESETNEQAEVQETVVIPPIVSADIDVIDSIFEVAREVDGILTLQDELSEEAVYVANYFRDMGWRFIILEVNCFDEEDAGIEYIPSIVERNNVDKYYSIICADKDYIAVVVDDIVQYEEEKYEE